MIWLGEAKLEVDKALQVSTRHRATTRSLISLCSRIHIPKSGRLVAVTNDLDLTLFIPEL